VDREHRPVGALGGGGERLGPAKIPVWSTSVPKKPAEIDTSEA
jgi:hypothetical protein